MKYKDDEKYVDSKRKVLRLVKHLLFIYKSPVHELHFYHSLLQHFHFEILFVMMYRVCKFSNSWK